MNKKLELTICMLTLTVLVASSVVAANNEVAVAPTPHSTYHSGEPYTTVYVPTEVPSPKGTILPKVTIKSPINNTVISSKNLTLAFDLTLEATNSHYPITLEALYYNPSWQGTFIINNSSSMGGLATNNITLELDSHSQFVNKTLPFSVNLKYIPEGSHSITVYASALCEYETARENKQVTYGPGPYLKGNYLYIYSNYYFIDGSSSINFTIDTSPTITPSINNNSNYETNVVLYAIGLTFLVIIATSAAVMVYSKKHKHKAE